MGATPVFALPYPELPDPPNIPLDMKELADRADAVIPRVLQGAGDPPTSGTFRAGDIYCRYL